MMVSQRAGMFAALALCGHAVLLGALGTVGQGATPLRATAPVVHVSLALPPAAGAASTPAPAMPLAEPVAAVPAPLLAPVPLLPLIAPAAEAHYYIPSELNERPRLVHEVAPDLSWIDLPAGPPQRAVLRLMINENGDVDLVRIEQAELPEAVMRAVVNAYSALKFSPGKIAGAAVKSQLRIEVLLENNA